MAYKLLYLGNRLNKKGRTPTSIETLGDFLELEGYEVIKYSSVKNQLLRLFDMLAGIIKQRKEAHYILIDTYSTRGFWFAYLSAKVARSLTLKYIPILRGGDLPKRLASHPKTCQKLFSRAHINVAPSAYLLHHFQEAGFKNLTYIPNTIAIKNYPFQLRENIQPQLLWVRSFAHIYNPMLALKVLEELLQEYPHAQLSMVGPFKDNSIEECRRYAQQKNLPVTFTGGMPKEEWLTYAKDFDIFINTTNVDNTPVSVIEAMALGLPVVTTNVGGIPYLLEDEKEALLVPPDDVIVMVNAIKSLLSNSGKAKSLSQTSRRKVEDFDWEIVKEKWAKVLC